MIFVIVGSQKFHFNRLLQALDECIQVGTITDTVFVQKGETMKKAPLSGELYVIITRFNINIKYAAATTKLLSEINPAVDEDYLRHRFDLFERYTVPSIKAQAMQDFIWVVLFHQDTPQKYKDKIAALQQSYPTFHPLYIAHTENYIETTNQYLLSFGAARYIMARIDNDDAFHCSFMQEVQALAHADASPEYLILFVNGLQYYQKRGFATKYHFPMNHFSALVTSNDGDGTLKNLLFYNHTVVDQLFLTKKIQNKQPLWLEVVHESNVSNRMQVKRESIVHTQEELAGFGAHIPLASNAVRIATIYAVLKKPINAIRLLKMYGIKGIALKAQEKALQ